MAFLNSSNKELKVVFTTKGKVESLKNGLLSQLMYFSVSDDNLLYTPDVLPSLTKDYSGCHSSSTDMVNNCKYKMNI